MKKLILITLLTMMLTTPALADDTTVDLGFWDKVKEFFDTNFNVFSEDFESGNPVDLYRFLRK